ncbi:uncharacterized protein VSU04_001859 [Chlamydotis macqueenii]
MIPSNCEQSQSTLKPAWPSSPWWWPAAWRPDEEAGPVGSVSLVPSKKNKRPLPSSVPGCPVEEAVPSCCLYSVQKQSSHLTQSLGNPVCESLSCTSISRSPAPFRACTTSPCQVSTVFNCLRTGSSSSSSLISVNVGERFGEQTPLKHLAAVLDSTCVAARIRPVCRCTKRKLVQATSVSCFSRKLLKPLAEVQLRMAQLLHPV